MQIGRLMTMVVVALGALSCPAYGLEELLSPAAKVQEQRRTARQKYLDELIRAIQATCDLSERQVKRLQVASKGAVEYSFSNEFNGLSRRPAAREIIWRLEVHQGEPRWGSNLDAAVAASHPIWTKTLGRTLTREQLDAAKAVAEEQRSSWSQREARNGVIWAAEPNRVLRVRRVQKLKAIPPARIEAVRRVQKRKVILPARIEAVRRLEQMTEPLTPPR